MRVSSNRYVFDIELLEARNAKKTRRQKNAIKMTLVNTWNNKWSGVVRHYVLNVHFWTVNSEQMKLNQSQRTKSPFFTI